MKQKLTKAERMIAKGLIELELENGFELHELNSSDLENQLRKITGNNNMDHRNDVEAHFDWLIKVGG